MSPLQRSHVSLKNSSVFVHIHIYMYIHTPVVVCVYTCKYVYILTPDTSDILVLVSSIRVVLFRLWSYGDWCIGSIFFPCGPSRTNFTLNPLLCGTLVLDRVCMLTRGATVVGCIAGALQACVGGVARAADVVHSLSFLALATVIHLAVVDFL